MEKHVFASSSSNNPAFSFSRRFFVEGVALPVEFDAVPVSLATGLGNEAEDMGTDFGDGEVPGGGAPIGSIVA